MSLSAKRKRECSTDSEKELKRPCVDFQPTSTSPLKFVKRAFVKSCNESVITIKENSPLKRFLPHQTATTNRDFLLPSPGSCLNHVRTQTQWATNLTHFNSVNHPRLQSQKMLWWLMPTKSQSSTQPTAFAQSLSEIEHNARQHRDTTLYTRLLLTIAQHS